MEDEAPEPPSRMKHINKRALKNKALSVSFNEKDLKDYVTGFHKRKKKRRKQAERQQEEVGRRKRIELRKKRKSEKEFALHGDAPPATTPEADGDEVEDDCEAVASVNDTKMYDNGDVKITVTTSDISREEDDHKEGDTETAALPRSIEAGKKHNIPVIRKKLFKKVVERRSRPKTPKKRDRKKGKMKKKKH